MIGNKLLIPYYKINKFQFLSYTFSSLFHTLNELNVVDSFVIRFHLHLILEWHPGFILHVLNVFQKSTTIVFTFIFQSLSGSRDCTLISSEVNKEKT